MINPPTIHPKKESPLETYLAKQPIVRLRRLQRRIRTTLVALGTISIALVIGIAWLVDKPSIGGAVVAGANSTLPSGAGNTLVAETPNFEAFIPDGKSIEELGGWMRVSPPDSESTYAFSDSIGQVQVIVSQQKLPDTLKDNDNPSALKDMAEGFGANRSLVVSDGTEVYIGTSMNGPQSVLLTKNGLLILMKSSNTIEDSDWIKYIDSLKLG